MKKTYTPNDLKEILEVCISYIQNTDEDSKRDYFLDIVGTGLFADAVGKVVRCNPREVETTTEY